MTDYVPKIVHLPSARLSPEVVLHRTLGKLAKIKAISVVIQWDDDTYDTDWSQMKVSELCMAAMSLEEEVRTVLRGEED